MPQNNLGLVLGVLVVMEDGLHLCTDTPEPLREGDFVVVRRDTAREAMHLQDERGSNTYRTAIRLIEMKGKYLRRLEAKRRENTERVHTR